MVKWVEIERTPETAIPGDLLAIQGYAVRDENRQRSSLKAIEGTSLLPLSDWELERVPKVLVSDYRELRPLAVVLREFRARRAASTRIDTVRYVLQVLADALAEYHEAGLIFGNITPSDVLIEGTPPDVHPRIPAYRFSQMVSSWERGVRGRGESRFSRERLTYLAPEQFESEVVDKGTDQYAFGLLAIALLQHRPPVEVKELQDLDAKRDFFRDPLQFDGPWKSRSPGLTKIIARALSYRPTDRWPTMRALSDALGPPATLQANNRQLAKQSYNRVKEQRDTFFRQFYDGLFASKKQLKRHFVGKGGQFDWAVQFLALDSAICRLLNFTSEEGLAEPTSLTDTARTHRDQLRLAPQDFDLFLDTFLEGSPTESMGAIGSTKVSSLCWREGTCVAFELSRRPSVALSVWHDEATALHQGRSRQAEVHGQIYDAVLVRR